MNGTPSPKVKATQTSLTVLKEIRDQNGATLAELTEALDPSRSTVHNHLVTLEQNGFIVREDGEYKLGMLLLHIGVQARHRNPDYPLTQTYVNALAEDTGLEADFCIEENGREISLYSETGSIDRGDLQAGGIFYLHNNATGKALLSEMSQDRVEQIIDKWGLPATTDKTITDESRLFEELETVRERGYAINDQELIDGFSAISMSCKYSNGDLFGALSVGGPSYRVEVEQDEITDHLSAAVEELEADIASSSEDQDINWWSQFLMSDLQ